MPKYTNEQLKTFHQKSFYLTCPWNFEIVSNLFLLSNLLSEMMESFYPFEVIFFYSSQRMIQSKFTCIAQLVEGDQMTAKLARLNHTITIATLAYLGFVTLSVCLFPKSLSFRSHPPWHGHLLLYNG